MEKSSWRPEHKLINDYYTLGEEIVHGITHGIGALLSAAGLAILVVLASLYGDVNQIVSMAIYGSTLIILYLASTLYHSFQHPPVKRILRIIDHACIFVLIAGTYTPFLLVAIRGVVGWTMLVVVWGLAVFGIVFKAIFIDRFRIISTLSYVGMGWLCIVIWNDMVANLSQQSIMFLAIGGVAYTAGVIFYAMDRVPYSHAIWHLFVLAGSIFHFFAILPLASGI